MANETVLVANFSHETNTFAPTPTTREDFRKRHEYFGEGVIEEFRGTNTSVGGAIDVAEQRDVRLVPAVAASATPGGTVSRDAFDSYKNRIVETARDHADELDGVLLPLHGAMVVQGTDDGEGPLVAALRDVLGDDVPVVVTLDLHGNITDRLVEGADALVAYETYPHVDMSETGRHGIELLLNAIRGEVELVMHVERPPLSPVTPLQNTREGPMADVMAKARELEEREDVLKVNVFAGFSRSDVPSMGFSIPVVADGDIETARNVSRDLARTVWEMREEFVGGFPGRAEAVSEARDLAADLEDDDGPVVLADVGDNPGGGGTADTTFVLRELLEQGATDAGLAIVRDEEVVQQCVDAGVGERVIVDLGAKTDTEFDIGEPIADVDGYVKALTDGVFVNTGSMGTGTENHLGTAAHLKCGPDDEVSVILTENRHQPRDAEIWRHVGVQPERLDILVVKSTNHYRADYEPMASHVIPINSPGLAAMDPRKFDYENVSRPKYPIDNMSADEYPGWE
jgi:microcystin degradation protein MlrC